ncbi:RAP domain [Seminavis robusta]|uniref:RAP domain n=1 Tax=Seminavis robusta TaxID=568900 RepID=A0A9N8EJ41_9STRA|nr:RAP domain [Seminavis robusta]|eukprot:Sro1081_g239080.1 RAP domain (641) ;mRNA; f:18549-20567
METSAVSGQQRVETWDLKEVDSSVKELTPAETLDATVDEISRQLTEIVSIEEEAAAQHANGGKTPPRQTKLGELCMVTWAYGILRPRRRPPGWLQPPQMDSLHSLAKKLGAKSRKDFLTFEEWTLNDEDDMSWKQNAKVEIDSSHSNPTDALFDTIAEALCRPSSQNETNFDATASLHDPQLELMRLSDCSWSEIANLAWAFEKCGRSLSPASETLLRALAHEAAWRLRTGGAKTRSMLSRDISQLIWALGTLQQDNFRLAHDLVILLDDFSAYMGFELNDANARDSRPFRSWSSPDIVQTILALSHARVDDSQLLLALFEEAHSRLDSGICASDSRREHGRKTFLAWEVCVLLWAQARLYLTAAEGDVYEQFPGAAVSNIIATSSSTSLNDIGIGPQEKANIAWALTVLEHHQSGEAIDLLRATFYDAAKACKQEGLIQLEHAHQLWQALFLLEEESPSAVSKVPKWFRQLLSDKWNLEKSRKKISSARHKSISQVLNLMGVAHYNEHDEDIDVAIVLKKQASWAHQTYAEESSSAMKVAVEFDGPNHFTRTRIPRGETMAAPVRALGHTVLKYRLLKRKGWTVVRVPFYEFDKIPFWASMERQRYLQRLLKTHANIRFSDVDISDYSAMAPNRKTRFD